MVIWRLSGCLTLDIRLYRFFLTKHWFLVLLGQINKEIPSEKISRLISCHRQRLYTQNRVQASLSPSIFMSFVYFLLPNPFIVSCWHCRGKNLRCLLVKPEPSCLLEFLCQGSGFTTPGVKEACQSPLLSVCLSSRVSLLCSSLFGYLLVCGPLYHCT